MTRSWALLILAIAGISVSAWGQQSTEQRPKALFCDGRVVGGNEKGSSFNAGIPIAVIANIVGAQPEVAAALFAVSAVLNITVSSADNLSLSAECDCQKGDCVGPASLISTAFLTRRITIGRDALAPGQLPQTVTFTVPLRGENRLDNGASNVAEGEKVSFWDASFRTSSAGGFNVGPIKLQFSLGVGAKIGRIKVGGSIPLGASEAIGKVSINCQCLSQQPIPDKQKDIPQACRSAVAPVISAPAVIGVAPGETQVSVPVTVRGLLLKEAGPFSFGDLIPLQDAVTDPETGEQTATLTLTVPIGENTQEFKIVARNQCSDTFLTGTSSTATVRVVRANPPKITAFRKTREGDQLLVDVAAQTETLAAIIIGVSSDVTDSASFSTGSEPGARLIFSESGDPIGRTVEKVFSLPITDLSKDRTVVTVEVNDGSTTISQDMDLVFLPTPPFQMQCSSLTIDQVDPAFQRQIRQRHPDRVLTEDDACNQQENGAKMKNS